MKEAFYANLPDSLVNELSELYQVAVAVEQSGESLADPVISDFNSAEPRFRDKTFHASGGMKIICQVMDSKTSRRIAMAELKEQTGEAEKMAQFIREAKITAALEHPNIVPIYDIGLNQFGKPYFLMKFLKDQSLKKILRELAKQNPAYTSVYTQHYLMDIFLKVSDAVAYAHSQGVIHLDLKPDNIMIGDYGEVYVCDWGLAKLVQAPENESSGNISLVFDELTTITLSGVIKGTPGFMAPEQIKSALGEKSVATDVYGLGAVLYSILTYKAPFSDLPRQEVLDYTLRMMPRPPSEIAIMKNIASSLDLICLKAMAKRGADRYQSVNELIQDLRAHREGFIPQAEQASLFKNTLMLIKRHHKLLSVCLLIVAVVLSLTLLFSAYLEDREAHASAAILQAEAEKSHLKKDAQKVILSLEQALQRYKQAWLRDSQSLAQFSEQHSPQVPFIVAKPMSQAVGDSVVSQLVYLDHEAVEARQHSLYLSKSDMFFSGVELPGQFAISFWLKPDALNEPVDWLMTDGGGKNKVNFSLDRQGRGEFSTYPDDTNTVRSTEGLIRPNQWTQVTLVHRGNGAGMEMYLNGRLAGAAPSNFTPATWGQLKFSGFNGWLDEWRIWARPLSAYEVYQNFKGEQISTQALIGHFGFDDPKGALVNRVINPGSQRLANSPTIMVLKAPLGGGGKVLSLHANDALQIPVNIPGKFTLSLWIWGATKPQDKSLELFTSGWDKEQVQIWCEGDGSIHFSTYDDHDNTATSAPGVIKFQQWQQVTFVHGGLKQGMKIFVDGQLVASAPANFVREFWGELTLQNFAGLVDEVRIWDKPLTTDEIEETLGNKPVAKRQLLGWYRFDKDSEMVVFDESGQNRHISRRNAK